MPDVTTTARWAAAQRARESQRPDRLFWDPFAAALAGEEGRMALAYSEKVNPREETSAYIAIRVKFLDDFILRLVSEGMRQIVIPAAGLDARAFRLDLPSDVTVYELDHPDLLADKNRILQREGAKSKCGRITIAADLRNNWTSALEQAGFRRSQPSIWILEGLLYYLPEKTVSPLFQQISLLAAKGSGLALDIVSRSTLSQPWMQAALEQMKESGFPWQFGSDEPEELLARFGWKAVARQLGDDGANYGRWRFPMMPRAVKETFQMFLVEARKT